MKIDKIAFPCSELFSPFWNIQSRIWKTKLGVHPVFLFYGDKKKCGLSEEFGDVVELKFDPSLPDIIQLQFSKFYYPSLEPETTWITGDIDLIPLQRDYFVGGIDHVPDDAYLHLNYSLCGRQWGMEPKRFFARGSRLTGGYDLPAHYHVAKGKLFRDLFFPEHPWDYRAFLNHIISSKRYGMIGAFRTKEEMPVRGDYWIAEETYTSEILWNHYSRRNFDGFFFRDHNPTTHRLEGKYGGAQNLFPVVWNGKDYEYDKDRLRRGEYVEIHCPLPYQPQEEALVRVLTEAGMM